VAFPGQPSWHQRIEAIAIDPHAGCLKGILSVLPDIPVTLTTYAIKLANAVIDHVRRRSSVTRSAAAGTNTTRCSRRAGSSGEDE